MKRPLLSVPILALALTGCLNAADAPEAAPAPFVSKELARFNEPWAMTFLPDGRLLVTEKQGKLKLHAIGGATGEVSGVPKVAYGGQGGFGDVVLHPKYADNGVGLPQLCRSRGRRQFRRRGHTREAVAR